MQVAGRPAGTGMQPDLLSPRARVSSLNSFSRHRPECRLMRQEKSFSATEECRVLLIFDWDVYLVTIECQPRFRPKLASVCKGHE